MKTQTQTEANAWVLDANNRYAPSAQDPEEAGALWDPEEEAYVFGDGSAVYLDSPSKQWRIA